MKGEAASISDIKFPCYASPKIDGFRCIVGPGGVPLSASLKPIPNEFVQEYFKRHANVLTGLDGELVVGEPTGDVFERTSGALRRKSGEPDFTFWVFDKYTTERPYRYRSFDLRQLDGPWGGGDRVLPKRVAVVEQEFVHTCNALKGHAERWLLAGYEGTMIRSPEGPYKFGRSTKREGYLLKIKPFVDHEAVVIGMTEEMANGNEAKTNELGRTERSSHKANKVGKGTLGTLVVRGLNGPFKDVEFDIGTGFTAEDRRALWNSPEPVVGCVATYKHMEGSGGYSKPRHPVFLRFRPDFDLEDTNGTT